MPPEESTITLTEEGRCKVAKHLLLAKLAKAGIDDVHDIDGDEPSDSPGFGYPTVEDDGSVTFEIVVAITATEIAAALAAATAEPA